MTKLDALLPLIVSRGEWGSGLNLNAGWNRNCDPSRLHEPRGIVIHHTDLTTEYNQASSHECAARIRYWFANHVWERGWSDLAYHYIVAPSGILFEGRRSSSSSPKRQGACLELLQGAHAKFNNVQAVGVALLGNYEEELPTRAATETLIALVRYLLEFLPSRSARAQTSWTYGYRDGRQERVERPQVVGHRDIRETSCPGDALYEMIELVCQALDN